MQFKKGDKVKFLNETGGGIVTAVIDSKLVKVETEDGFEIPVLSKDLIPDYREEETRQIQSDFARPENKPAPASEKNMPETEEPSLVSEINPWVEVKEDEGFYLLFEPHEQQWVLTGDLDVILVNHTPFDILYNLFLERNGKTEGIDYGSVPPESKIVLATISHDEIEQWNRGIFQILIHENQPEKIYLPVHAQIDIRVNRFFKEGSYQTNTLTNSRAIVSVIATKSMLTVAENGIPAKKAEPVIKENKTTIQREIPFIEKFRTAPGEAVVDLHIGEIVDNIAGLDSRDMLQLQLNHFRKALESALMEEYHKVTFIHGVGNGVLKNAIIKEIKNYENVEGHMASIIKFGVGALDVSINSPTN